MVRSVNVELLTENIKEMCIQANHFLAPDMDKAMRSAHERETKPLAKQILGQLLENLDIAGEDMIPICQDTGMACIPESRTGCTFRRRQCGRRSQ